MSACFTVERCAPANDPTTVPLPPVTGTVNRIKSRRYESLDMWRGLCCLMLVVFHTTMQQARYYFVGQSGSVNSLDSLGIWLAARAWIGVPIFFVISGYCIMATLHARRDKGVVEFAKRRFWRIYPPYWTAIGLSAVIILALNARWPGLVHDGIFTVPNPDKMSVWEWLGNLTLTESWRHTVFGGNATHLLPNTWTLCYEEQFYVVAALILLFASRRIFTAAVVVTVIILVGKTITWRAGWEVKGSLFDGGWFQIAAGILLYYRVNRATPAQIRWIHAALVLGIIVSLRNPSHLLEFYPNHDTERFVAYTFALAMSFLYPYDKRLQKAALLRPFRRVGGMSYSVYLCHPLIAKGISFALFSAGIRGNAVTLLGILPLIICLSLAVAYLFHRLIERHFIPRASSARVSAPTVPIVALNGSVASVA
ncbi:MAG TPA: acyltransferase [Pirellulales bacterium]|jgi:peptidoglycan/LPS O-acetylase OafA/YrhL|nr:acyltransferase [Pirellulales bacterium]